MELERTKIPENFDLIEPSLSISPETQKSKGLEGVVVLHTVLWSRLDSFELAKTYCP